MAGALEELDGDDRLSVGVLTGAGGFFCAGMDLGAFVKGESPWFGDRGFAGIAQRASRKPLIAAIEGFALAGGMEIALACDLIVAAKGAKLGIPEAKRSLVAAGGALLRLPRRMPYHVVMELALTGDAVPAERFHEFGVVNRVAEPGSAVEVALELAASSPRTVRSRWSPPSASCRSSSTGRARRCGRSRRDHRACVRLRGRQRGGQRVQGQARRGLERALASRRVACVGAAPGSPGSVATAPPSALSRRLSRVL